MFDQYGRVTGDGQIAPGRDLPQMQDSRRRRRQNPDIQSAITGGMPIGGVQPPMQTAQPVAKTEMPPQGGGGVANPLVTPSATPVAAPVSSVSQAQRDASREMLFRGGFGGKLDGSDTFKIDDADHIKKSPKYSFASTAQDLGLSGKTEDLPVLLAELQKRDPRFAGFKIGGSKGDHLIYGGDPSQLDSAFNGLSDIDAVLSAGEGGKGFAWQDPKAGGPPLPSGVLQNAIMGGPEQTVGMDSDYAERMRQQIMAALQGTQPTVQQLGKLFGY